MSESSAAEDGFEVEKILKSRMKDGVEEFKVRWKSKCSLFFNFTHLILQTMDRKMIRGSQLRISQ